MIVAFILWFDHFLDSRAEICQIFRWFFGKFKTSKRRSEINWPLETLEEKNGQIVAEESKDCQFIESNATVRKKEEFTCVLENFWKNGQLSFRWTKTREIEMERFKNRKKDNWPEKMCDTNSRFYNGETYIS